MKSVIKRVAIVIMLFIMTLALASCGNYDTWDTVYTYNYAIVKFPDGSVEKITIKKWCDYDGEQIQIIAKDDTVYLVNSVNCILVKE